MIYLHRMQDTGTHGRYRYRVRGTLTGTVAATGVVVGSDTGQVLGTRVVGRVLPHWVNSSLTDGHAYVTYGSTIWELVGTRIQYKFEILVVFLVGMDII